VTYYDVTNYYFETDIPDDLRKKGFSKENRKTPIVQMGLLLDKAGLPISYKLFPGNTHDSQTLMPMLKEIKKTFGVSRIIVVADKGLNSGDNIAFNTALGDGYIFSKSVRGASEEFKAWILNETGYYETRDAWASSSRSERPAPEKLKLKSMVVPDVEIEITVEQIGMKKKKKKIKVEQKWVAFYSIKYAVRAKRKREEVIAKAVKMIKNPALYRNSVDYGVAGYIENIKFDKETGEVTNSIEETLILNTKKIEEEEKYDGYYAIITSELDDSDLHIIDMYRGLWRIEDTFKVTKSVLETRPIFLRTQKHINAHFLSCFISLLIARILELKLKNKYTIDRITETLQQVACSNIDQNIWLFDYSDEVTQDIHDIFKIDFGKKVMNLSEIKKVVGDTKYN
jgi:transposase